MGDRELFTEETFQYKMLQGLRIPSPYEIRDGDSGCGDPDCCGSPWPQLYVWLDGRKGWYGYFSDDDKWERAEIFVRRLKRWNVK